MPAISDKEPDVKPLEVERGQRFAIQLWEDRTRGEQWVPCYDSAVFALTDDEFVRTASNNAVDAGKRTFEFQALEAGRHRLEFHKRLAWKFTAEDRRVFQVHVHQDTHA
ncbi:MAG: hypothetical protein D6704_07845 [Nitrospirae bacterium]|nr:MAG: hypothetical protein D6704_07845 [Nitrospirota bacterium]